MKVIVLLVFMVFGIWLCAKASPIPCDDKDCPKKIDKRVLPEDELVSQEEKTATDIVKTDDTEDRTLQPVEKAPQKENREALIVKRDVLKDRMLLQENQASQKENAEATTMKIDDSTEPIIVKRDASGETKILHGEHVSQEQTEAAVVKIDDSEDKISPQKEQVPQEGNTEKVIVKRDASGETKILHGQHVSQEQTEAAVVKIDDSEDKISPQKEQIPQEGNTEKVIVKRDASGETKILHGQHVSQEQTEAAVVKIDDSEDKISPQKEQVPQEGNTEKVIVKRDASEDKILLQEEQVSQDQNTESSLVKINDSNVRILQQEQKISQGEIKESVVKRDASGDRILLHKEQVSQEQTTDTIVVKVDDSKAKILPETDKVSRVESTKTHSVEPDDSEDFLAPNDETIAQDEITETHIVKRDDWEGKILPQDEQVSYEEKSGAGIVKREDLVSNNATKRSNFNATASSEYISAEATANFELLLENQETESEIGEGNNGTESIREKREDYSNETNAKVELLSEEISKEYDDVNKTVILKRSVTSVPTEFIKQNNTKKAKRYPHRSIIHWLLESPQAEEVSNETTTVPVRRSVEVVAPEPIREKRNGTMRELLNSTESAEIISDKTDISIEALLEITEMDEEGSNKTAKHHVRRSLLAVTNLDGVEAQSTSPDAHEESADKLEHRNLRDAALSDTYISCTCVIFPYHGGMSDNINCDLPIISKRTVRVPGESAETNKKEKCVRICTDSAGIIYLKPNGADCRPEAFYENEIESLDKNGNRIICNVAAKDLDDIFRKLSKWYSYMVFNTILCLSVLFMAITYYTFCRKYHKQVKVYRALGLIKLRSKTDAVVDVESK